MNRLRRPVLALVVCALGCIVPGASAQDLPGTARTDSIEAAIRAVHALMQRTAEKLDASGVYTHVLDTATPPIIEDGVVRGDRAAALAITAAGLQRVNRVAYRYTRQQVTVLSPTLALWVGEGSASVTLADGTEIGGPFAETVLFALRDGQWKVLHAHRSSPNS
jgi:hypothetical protein